ncbi:hypothetical protein [Ruegeria sp.]|uniref:hypothetical protein n=1 Tax=Ruegeria sp. TaxID=1879320 RepID=UPI00231D08D6|nr:hypothetical protein [Ruegeria sp.]MDA7966143.1 hypothetical protein [Ruegeria sp.]
MPLKLRNIYVSATLLSDAKLVKLGEVNNLDNHSRAVCNYIYRNFRAPEFSQVKPSRLLILMAVEPRKEAYLGDGCLIAEIDNHLEKLRDLPSVTELEPYAILGERQQRVYYREPEIHEFVISCLGEGLIKLEQAFGIPRSRVLETADQFRHAGYKNRWIHKTKKHKQTGCVGNLEFTLTSRAFSVDFVLIRNGDELFRERIKTCSPDEGGWWGRIKELNYDRGLFLVPSVNWKKSLAEMLGVSPYSWVE